MDEKTVKIVYEEIKKRIEEGKLVLIDFGVERGIHTYECVICIRETN